MSKCVNCNLSILDDTDVCPLCQHVLIEEGQGRDTYPDARVTTRHFRLFENIVLFLSIVIVTVTCVIELMVSDNLIVTIIEVLALLYVNVLLKITILGKSGYLFKTLSSVIFTLAVLLGIDYVTGYREWSVNFVLPAAVLVLDLIIIIMMIVNRRNWQSYMMVEIFTVLVSIVPLVMILFNMASFPYLAVAALGASVFLFLGTLIIGDHRARTELKRRFHV